MAARVPPPLPVLPDLGPVPRANIGPFMLLGLDKDADKEAIEAGWAQRLIWARKGLVSTPLEDINWARDILSDRDRRWKADVGALNVDTVDGLLKQLRDRYQGKGKTEGCQPIDVEKSLAGYQPPTPIPELEEVKSNLPQPEPPRDVPAVQVILEQFVRQPLDAWNVDIE